MAWFKFLMCLALIFLSSAARTMTMTQARVLKPISVAREALQMQFEKEKKNVAVNRLPERVAPAGPDPIHHFLSSAATTTMTHARVFKPISFSREALQMHLEKEKKNAAVNMLPERLAPAGPDPIHHFLSSAATTKTATQAQVLKPISIAKEALQMRFEKEKKNAPVNRLPERLAPAGPDPIHHFLSSASTTSTMTQAHVLKPISVAREALKIQFEKEKKKNAAVNMLPERLAPAGPDPIHHSLR